MDLFIKNTQEANALGFCKLEFVDGFPLGWAQEEAAVYQVDASLQIRMILKSIIQQEVGAGGNQGGAKQ